MSVRPPVHIFSSNLDGTWYVGRGPCLMHGGNFSQGQVHGQGHGKTLSIMARRQIIMLRQGQWKRVNVSIL